MLEIAAGDFRFIARLEEEPPRRPWPPSGSCCRWRAGSSTRAGAARSCWIPFGELDVGLGQRTRCAIRRPADILWYPGGVSETEILFPYGSTSFASKAGPLAGNHFATVLEASSDSAELGRKALWEGAQPIRFDET